MELRNMTLQQLKELWRERRDELLMIKREIDRREGDEVPTANVDFESYVTK